VPAAPAAQLRLHADAVDFTSAGAKLGPRPRPPLSPLSYLQGLASLDPPFHLRIVDRLLGGGSGGGSAASSSAGGAAALTAAAGAAGGASSGAARRPGGGAARRGGRRGWPWAAVRWGGADLRGGRDRDDGSGTGRRDSDSASWWSDAGGDSEDGGDSDRDGGGGTPRAAAAVAALAAGRAAGAGAASRLGGGSGGGGGGATGSGRELARLPSAHTCGRVLELPRYESEAELRERLRVVLSWAREGMGLA
jgi:hypothetical protein